MSRGSQDARLTPQVRRSQAEKILVVDDEPKLVQNVKAYLEDASYRVVTAADGHEALEVFEREQPDLIILDLRLPKLHGMEVARAVRSASTVPIIMLTAQDGDADLIAGLEAGADDYVTKPFNPRELVARVRAVLRRAEARSSSAPATVFVSSVIEGYAAERQAVRDAGYALQNEGHDVRPVLAEEIPATGREAPRESLLEEVDASDVYAGVLGRRYGYVNPHSGLSATEEEYRRALEHAKPILLFVEQLPDGEEGEARQREFIEAVTDYVSGHYVSFFENLDQLRLQADHALVRQLGGSRS